MNRLERLLKYAEGGKVRKFATGGPTETQLRKKARAMGLDYDTIYGDAIGEVGAGATPLQVLNQIALNLSSEQARATEYAYDYATYGGQVSLELYNNTKTNVALLNLYEQDMAAAGQPVTYSAKSDAKLSTGSTVDLTMNAVKSESDNSENITPGIDTLGLDAFVKTGSAIVGSFGGLTGINGTIGFNLGYEAAKRAAESGDSKDIAGAVVGTVGGAAVLAMGIAELALMSDKNFSAGSRTIDSIVHGASGALLKSGNPWAMGAGLALEGLNWITKAGGKNVLGYDVNINNSGYGNMGHQESEAGRIWDNWNGATAKKLAKRNEQARMALAAMDISEDTAYEQEARQNSVTNVLQLNQIALSGGIDTSLLGS